MSEKVCVIGLGYVGLPLAALCASKGFQVIGYDMKQSVVDKTNKGISHIKDERLQNLRLVAAGLKSLQLAHEEEWLDVVKYCYELPLWRAEDIKRFARVNGLDIGPDEVQLIHKGTKGIPLTCAIFIKNLSRS